MKEFDAIGSELPEDVQNESDEEILYQQPSNDKADEELTLRKKQVTGLSKQVDYFKSLHNLRRNVAYFIFFLIFTWLTCVMYLVFLGSYDVYIFQGKCGDLNVISLYQKYKIVPEGCTVLKNGTYLNLTESIVIALITTTTINVLGLSFIVAKWLFPTNGNSDNSKVDTKS